MIGARSLPNCPKRSWHKKFWRWPQGDNTWMEHKCRSTAINFILASVYEAPGLFCVIGNWEKSHWHAQKNMKVGLQDLPTFPHDQPAGWQDFYKWRRDQVKQQRVEWEKAGKIKHWALIGILIILIYTVWKYVNHPQLYIAPMTEFRSEQMFCWLTTISHFVQSSSIQVT